MIQKKILGTRDIKSFLTKNRNKKVVFTNGCFDILHAGHVTYLEKARKLGDVLIVALNTDASTARLKGPTRPINKLQDRMKVIAALESVSYVIPFAEDTPLKLIQKILPDVLVKGGDYDPKKIVGYQEVTEKGGKVLALPFVKGRSTTQIIAKAKMK